MMDIIHQKCPIFRPQSKCTQIFNAFLICSYCNLKMDVKCVIQIFWNFLPNYFERMDYVFALQKFKMSTAIFPHSNLIGYFLAAKLDCHLTWKLFNASQNSAITL